MCDNSGLPRRENCVAYCEYGSLREAEGMQHTETVCVSMYRFTNHQQQINCPPYE
jgi:hypothetical protein